MAKHTNFPSCVIEKQSSCVDLDLKYHIYNYAIWYAKAPVKLTRHPANNEVLDLDCWSCVQLSVISLWRLTFIQQNRLPVFRARPHVMLPQFHNYFVNLLPPETEKSMTASLVQHTHIIKRWLETPNKVGWESAGQL
jgi:hypothetical protein